MYEQFGAAEVGNTGQVRFRVFVPDAGLDPGQYQRGRASTIQTMQVFGDFQAALGGVDWAKEPAFTLARSQFVDPADGRAKGWLYELTTGPLPEGFYQYKLWVTFASGTERKVCDPCTRYGGADSQNSAFVIGGPKRDTAPLADPLPPAELVIYELMIDDFTADFRAGRAPLAAVTDKLAYLQTLGVNAVEFMPWTQWPGANFDWGYTPQGYFAVAYPLHAQSGPDDAEKLFLLKTLVIALPRARPARHPRRRLRPRDRRRRGERLRLPVAVGEPGRLAVLRALLRRGVRQDLDYGNGCLLDFIVDVCCYWIDVFKIDGIRFDETSGFYDATRSALGLPA